MEWCDLPMTPGFYLTANPLITPLRPSRVSVFEADGVELAGLNAGLWVTVPESGMLSRVEDRPVIWFGPIPLDGQFRLTKTEEVADAKH